MLYGNVQTKYIFCRGRGVQSMEFSTCLFSQLVILFWLFMYVLHKERLHSLDWSNLDRSAVRLFHITRENRENDPFECSVYVFVVYWYFQVLSVNCVSTHIYSSPKSHHVSECSTHCVSHKLSKRVLQIPGIISIVIRRKLFRYFEFLKKDITSLTLSRHFLTSCKFTRTIVPKFGRVNMNVRWINIEIFVNSYSFLVVPLHCITNVISSLD